MPETVDFTLPTEKRAPATALGTILVYARPKIGKTTLAHEFDPEGLHLDTEGSAKVIAGFVLPISSWEEFRKAGALLAELPADHPYRRTTVIDTVDALVPMCADDVIAKLAAGAGQSKARSQGKQFHHASDFDFGKGWAAIADEFKLRLGKLMALVDTLILVSHEEIATVKDGIGREVSVARPDVSPRSVREWLLGAVDWILYGHMGQTEDGQRRLLYTHPGENYVAGGRAPRGKAPAPVIDFDGPTLRGELEALYAPPPAPPKSKGKKKPEPEPEQEPAPEPEGDPDSPADLPVAA
jgi:hypothetical protein